MADESDVPGLVDLADQLYAEPPDRFTEARNRLAAELADKALATEVKRLKKPSLAAWAVNYLVRRESEQIDQVLGMADSLRAAAAALDGEELRALHRQRRQLTTALAGTARRLAHDLGIRLTAAVGDQVEGVLNAAMLDPVAGQVVRAGRLVTAFTSTGVSELEAAAVLAVPDELDVRAQPLEARDAEPATLRVVPDEAAKLARARDAVTAAAEAVEQVSAELVATRSEVERLQARRLQLQGEAEELRRRLAEIEEDVETLDDELEEAQDAVAEGDRSLERLRGEHEQAQAELHRLEG